MKSIELDKEDFKWFKSLTLYNTVLMGRNTWQTLPNKFLPQRANIVLTKDPSKIDNIDEVTVFNSLEAAKVFIDSQLPLSEVFVIGGANVYTQTLDLCDVLYVTEYQTSTLADVFFPEIDNSWELIAESVDLELDSLIYTHKVYFRRDIDEKSAIVSISKFEPLCEWKYINFTK